MTTRGRRRRRLLLLLVVPVVAKHGCDEELARAATAHRHNHAQGCAATHLHEHARRDASERGEAVQELAPELLRVVLRTALLRLAQDAHGGRARERAAVHVQRGAIVVAPAKVVAIRVLKPNAQAVEVRRAETLEADARAVHCHRDVVDVRVLQLRQDVQHHARVLCEHLVRECEPLRVDAELFAVVEHLHERDLVRGDLRRRRRAPLNVHVEVRRRRRTGSISVRAHDDFDGVAFLDVVFERVHE